MMEGKGWEGHSSPTPTISLLRRALWRSTAHSHSRRVPQGCAREALGCHTTQDRNIFWPHHACLPQQARYFPAAQAPQPSLLDGERGTHGRAQTHTSPCTLSGKMFHTVSVSGLHEHSHLLKVYKTGGTRSLSLSLSPSCKLIGQPYLLPPQSCIK